MRKIPKEEDLRKEFLAKYKIEPTARMLKEYARYRPMRFLVEDCEKVSEKVTKKPIQQTRWKTQKNKGLKIL